MKKGKIILTVILFLFLIIPCAISSPKRELGLSAHLLPKRVADLDETGEVKWGYIVSQTENLKTPLERPVFQEPNNLIAYFLKQSSGIQQNGIWVVTTNPTAYSNSEKESVETLKKLCKNKKISLFFCRGSKLPNGWLKADLFTLKTEKVPKDHIGEYSKDNKDADENLLNAIKEELNAKN